MKLLVWCPELIPGGCSRLFKQLIPSIANHRDVEWVRVATTSTEAAASVAVPNYSVARLIDPSIQNSEVWMTSIGKLILEWGRGFCAIEGHLGGSWRWCGNQGELRIHNPSRSTVRIVLDFGISTWYEELSTIHLSGPLLDYKTQINRNSRWCSFSLPVPPGQHGIFFSCDGRPVESSWDTRTMVFRVCSFSVKEDFAKHKNPTLPSLNHAPDSSPLQFVPAIMNANRSARSFTDQMATVEKHCDLVYAFWPHRHEMPATDKPVVCTFQDTILFDFPEILGIAETQEERERAESWLRKSNKVVVSSHHSRERIIRHFGTIGESCHVIHHAITPISPSMISEQTFSGNLPAGYIVYGSHLTEHKNHAMLLRAWARFKERDRYPLVLFGDGTNQLNRPALNAEDQLTLRVLIALINRLELKRGKDLICLGYLEDRDIVPLIRNATALIMPSLAEGGGSYPVEEALRLGTPVLCSDLPVIREQVEGRSAQICWFDPESPESIVRALHHLIENYEEIKRRSVIAIDDPRPAWEDIAGKYVQVFQDVLRSASS